MQKHVPRTSAKEDVENKREQNLSRSSGPMADKPPVPRPGKPAAVALATICPGDRMGGTTSSPCHGNLPAVEPLNPRHGHLPAAVTLTLRLDRNIAHREKQT